MCYLPARPSAFPFPPSPFPPFLPYSGIPGNTSSLSPLYPYPTPHPPYLFLSKLIFHFQLFSYLPRIRCQPRISPLPTYLVSSSISFHLPVTLHDPIKFPRPDASVPPDVRVSLNQETATTMPRGKNCI